MKKEYPGGTLVIDDAADFTGQMRTEEQVKETVDRGFETIDDDTKWTDQTDADPLEDLKELDKTLRAQSLGIHPTGHAQPPMPKTLKRRVPKRDCNTCHGRGIVPTRLAPGEKPVSRLCGCVKLRSIPTKIALESDRIQREMKKNLSGSGELEN